MTREEAKAWLEHHFDPIPDGTKQSEAVSLAIKALEQEPYEKFESVKDHICKLAGDYKCWDNRLTDDEALELCRILEQETCEDAVSREAILLEIDKIKDNYGGLLDVARFIRGLPSVNPQPKTENED